MLGFLVEYRFLSMRIKSKQRNSGFLLLLRGLMIAAGLRRILATYDLLQSLQSLRSI